MERLQKFMARAGVASRRKSEEMIAAGRVAVNGRVVREPGVQVDAERDRIEVDGKLILAPARFTYLLLNKPVGSVSTATDTHGRPTVVDLVSPSERLYPVGRLDIDSEGLILLTNDGELTQRVTHPRYEHDKEYHVLVAGLPTAEQIERLRRGIELEDGVTSPAEVDVIGREGNNSWLRFVIHEGKKRQIRRMCAAIGHPVRRLVRVRIGPLTLGELRPGEYRALSATEEAALRQWAGLS